MNDLTNVSFIATIVGTQFTKVMPILGIHKALSNVTAKAKKSSEPYQEPYTLLAKEYFCDEKGVYEPLVALNTPYGDHLVIN